MVRVPGAAAALVAGTGPEKGKRGGEGSRRGGGAIFKAPPQRAQGRPLNGGLHVSTCKPPRAPPPRNSVNIGPIYDRKVQ